MFRKNLIISSFLALALAFAGVAYAGSCPGSDGCPILVPPY